MWCCLLVDTLAYLDVKIRAAISEYEVVFAVLYAPVAAHILYWYHFFSSTVNCV